MDKNAHIYVAGHSGLVGSAILRKLEGTGYQDLIRRRSEELDLRDSSAVQRFFQVERPEYVFLAAAKVGGILANATYPAEFIYDNLMIQTNVIHAAYTHGVKKLLFLGSSCIYPKFAPQPMKEEHLLTDTLEPTNEAYAIAKTAGIKMCQAYRRQYGANFIAAMPTNLYGPYDNFDLENAHVIPALMRRFHEAKLKVEPEVAVWGTGQPRREFLYVEDLADACLFLMLNYDGEQIVNVGVGEDTPIRALAELVKETVGYQGALVFDISKPDGTPRKLLDVSRLFHMGWRPKVKLSQGVRQTYAWFVKHYDELVCQRKFSYTQMSK